MDMNRLVEPNEMMLAPLGPIMPTFTAADFAIAALVGLVAAAPEEVAVLPVAGAPPRAPPLFECEEAVPAAPMVVKADLARLCEVRFAAGVVFPLLTSVHQDSNSRTSGISENISATRNCAFDGKRTEEVAGTPLSTTLVMVWCNVAEDLLFVVLLLPLPERTLLWVAERDGGCCCCWKRSRLLGEPDRGLVSGERGDCILCGLILIFRGDREKDVALAKMDERQHKPTKGSRKPRR